MKTRNSFVSNSSSSSFIVIGRVPEVTHMKLSSKQAALCIHSLASDKYHDTDIEWNPETEDVYLTKYISDSCDLHYDMFRQPKTYEYVHGNHGTPYDPDNYNELLEGQVWIHKADDPQTETQLIYKLYEVCNDDYLPFLDELLEDAGLVWKCVYCHDINMNTESKCSRCKRGIYENP